MKGFLITGTDTGIGKTYVGVHLAKAFLNQGIKKVGVFKPVETGVLDIPQDALALKEAAQCCEGLEVVCPYTFRDPVAPYVASKREGRPILLSILQDTYQRIAERHEMIIVETAGGLMVPINEKASYADLALLLKLPVVVVVGKRLGAINHALLTIETAKAKKLDLLGFVINEFQEDTSPGAASVESVLKEFSNVPVLGTVHYQGDASRVASILSEKILEFAR